MNHLNETTRDWIEALLILASFLIPAIILRMAWAKVIGPWFKRSKNANIVLLVRPLRVLVVWALTLSGINFALQSLEYFQDNPTLSVSVEKALSIAWTILAMVVATRFFVGWFHYKERRNLKEGQDFHARISTAQKLTTGIIILFGALSILRIGGIDISPLLAGGAIGGIIIGLALQDSLSNVFAGLFLNIDRPIREGELLWLDQDREGFVEEVGWRYTKVRLLNDSLLIIPNNKFGQSSFINFDRTVSDLGVAVTINVAYGSDPMEVEAAAIEAAKEAQARVAPEEAEAHPYVRWESMSEKMATLKVYMRTDRSSRQYHLTSECIRLILKKFPERGISFPSGPPTAMPA